MTVLAMPLVPLADCGLCGPDHPARCHDIDGWCDVCAGPCDLRKIRLTVPVPA